MAFSIEQRLRKCSSLFLYSTPADLCLGVKLPSHLALSLILKPLMVQAAGASSSADGASWGFRFPILSELIVVDTAIGRDAASCKVRLEPRPFFRPRSLTLSLHFLFCIFAVARCILLLYFDIQQGRPDCSLLAHSTSMFAASCPAQQKCWSATQHSRLGLLL